jgi:PAS domain S-box-containing protein
MGNTDAKLRRRLDVLEKELLVAGVGTYRYTFDGTIVEIDRGALVLFDLADKVKDPEELVGRNITELLVYIEAPGTLLEQVRKLRTVRNLVCHYRTLSGKERWTLQDSCLTADSATGQETIQVVAKDITKLKHAEEALRTAYSGLGARVAERTAELSRANLLLQQQITDRERAEEQLRSSEQRFAAILDNTLAVVFVKDPDGRYVLINRRYEQLFKITKQEIIGRTDHDIFPTEAADQFRRNDLEVLRTGKPLEVEELVPQEDGLHCYI